MKHHQNTRLNSHEQEHTNDYLQARQTTAIEFASADEMIRHDAGQAAVPPEVARRLRESIEQEGPPPRPWWQRMFGG